MSGGPGRGRWGKEISSFKIIGGTDADRIKEIEYVIQLVKERIEYRLVYFNRRQHKLELEFIDGLREELAELRARDTESGIDRGWQWRRRVVKSGLKTGIKYWKRQIGR